MDSLRFVVCAQPACHQVFFLCRRCDRGDRYCSRPCAQRARRTTLHAAARRYQRSWRGRLRHAARQARYRGRPQNVTHQTSPAAAPEGMVTPLPARPTDPAGWQEAPVDAPPPVSRRPGPPRCTRCGHPGRWVRQVTLAHLRPRPVVRR